MFFPVVCAKKVFFFVRIWYNMHMNGRLLSSIMVFVICAICPLSLILVGCSDSLTINFPQLDDLTGPLSVHKDDPSNPYRDLLIPCVKNGCSLARLPFIGMMDPSSPTTMDDLMNRVIVSHAWMGERFEQALMSMYWDDKARDVLLQMSRSLVAIVIGANVRPSYYRPDNSVVLIDPFPLALPENANEVDVIDQSPDFRLNFGSDLRFVGTWRYVKDDDYFFFLPLDFSLSLDRRDLRDVAHYLAFLLFHEFAHANDHYPHNTISAISCTNNPERCAGTPKDNFNSWANANRISRDFGIGDDTGTDYRIHDRNMERYAAVRYLGSASTADQRRLSASVIGGRFENDVASHDYAYTNEFEDVAVLSETALLKYLFDADLDFAYIDKPSSGTVDDNTPVTWGVRGRIGSDGVKRRTQEFMRRILPGVVPDSFFTDLGPPQPLDSACGWIDNLDLACSSAPDALRRGGALGTVPR